VHLIELLGDVGQVEVCFGLLGDVLTLAQDRSTVCAKCTMGMEFFLVAPDGPPR
jgi:hypothetical protein